MNQPHIIPELFIDNFDGFVNLNVYRYLDNIINDFQYTHRRILPSIMINKKLFTCPIIDSKAQIIYKHKNEVIVLGYKD